MGAYRDSSVSQQPTLEHAVGFGAPRGFPINFSNSPGQEFSNRYRKPLRRARTGAPDDRRRETIELWRREELGKVLMAPSPRPLQPSNTRSRLATRRARAIN